MRQPGRRVRFALCITAVILCGSVASARTERLRWTQSTTPVDNFKLYWGTSSGSYSSSLNVGVPAKDSTGAYFYDVVVADTGTFYFAVTAWYSGLESPKSNQISRTPTTTTPPPPPPTTGTKPNAPTVTASGWTVSVQPATTGSAATGGWIKLYPFDAQGNALTFADPVSGGALPRSLDLTPYFAEQVGATRIEAEGCAENSYGFTCAVRVNVPRSAAPPPGPGQVGTPGQPYIVP